MQPAESVGSAIRSRSNSTASGRPVHSRHRRDGTVVREVPNVERERTHRVPVGVGQRIFERRIVRQRDGDARRDGGGYAEHEDGTVRSDFVDRDGGSVGGDAEPRRADNVVRHQRGVERDSQRPAHYLGRQRGGGRDVGQLERIERVRSGSAASRCRAAALSCQVGIGLSRRRPRARAKPASVAAPGQPSLRL